jgi:hypothetical protein
VHAQTPKLRRQTLPGDTESKKKQGKVEENLHLEQGME